MWASLIGWPHTTIYYIRTVSTHLVLSLDLWAFAIDFLCLSIDSLGFVFDLFGCADSLIDFVDFELDFVVFEFQESFFANPIFVI